MCSWPWWPSHLPLLQKSSYLHPEDMALCVSYRTKKYLKKTGWSIPLEMLSRNCALSQSRWPDSCYLVIIDEDLTVFKASKLIYETIHFTNSLVFIDLFSIYLKGWEEEWGILIEFPSTGSLSNTQKQELITPSNPWKTHSPWVRDSTFQGVELAGNRSGTWFQSPWSGIWVSSLLCQMPAWMHCLH